MKAEPEWTLHEMAGVPFLFNHENAEAVTSAFRAAFRARRRVRGSDLAYSVNIIWCTLLSMDQLAGLPEGTPGYEDAVKRLPVPSWDQSERFARYLSEAHSWYKLPVDRERPFFLFLDPTAGCTMEYRENKPWRPLEITESGGLRHHWHTTQQYREFFGFWNYHQTPDGFPASETSPEVWLSDGSRILLSDDWTNAGLALLDAFVHTDTPIGYIGGLGRFTKEKWPAESIFDRIGLCLKERLVRHRHRLKDLLEAQIPANFRIALKAPDISCQPGRPAHVWPDDGWKQQLLDLQVPQDYWSPLCKYFELLTREQQLGEMLDGIPSSPDFPVGFFAMALAEERVLQLIRLTDAMDSFLRRLGASRASTI
jgi:hypothetical protein